MADEQKQLKLAIDATALKMIDKECRARGMTRSEFLTRAGLSFCGASPFAASEEKQIQKMIDAAIEKLKDL